MTEIYFFKSYEFKILTLMIPVALKLPLWNGPPIFLTHLGSQESEKTGGDLVRREDSVPPNF